MKKHMAFIFGLSFISSYAADPVYADNSLLAEIPYYTSQNDVLNNRATGIIQISITPNTTLLDVQDSIRKQLGHGDLVDDNGIKFDAKPRVIQPFSVTFPLLMYAKDDIENSYVFWNF